MRNHRPTVAVSALGGLLSIKASGIIDAWHSMVLEDLLEGAAMQDWSELTLDISQASFSDMESTSVLIRMLRKAAGRMRVATIACDGTAGILKSAGFEPVTLERADAGNLQLPENDRPEYFTSRWMAGEANDKEMPLAA